MNSPSAAKPRSSTSLRLYPKACAEWQRRFVSNWTARRADVAPKLEPTWRQNHSPTEARSEYSTEQERRHVEAHRRRHYGLGRCDAADTDSDQIQRLQMSPKQAGEFMGTGVRKVQGRIKGQQKRQHHAAL